MLILFAFVLLVLAAAVGVLFAMSAELSRRVGTGGTPTAEPVRYVRPLDRPNVYLRESANWPAQLSSVRANTDFLLIVLSTSCTTCNTIGEQLGKDDWSGRTAGQLGVVLSTPDPRLAEAFVAKNGLAAFHYYIDSDGDWTDAALGLSMSPVGLIFRHGQLDETYVFNHVDPLWTTFKEATEWKQHSHLNQASADHSHAGDSSAPSARVV